MSIPSRTMKDEKQLLKDVWGKRTKCLSLGAVCTSFPALRGPKGANCQFSAIFFPTYWRVPSLSCAITAPL